MSEILQIKKPFVYDESIANKQFHTYSPYTSSFNNNDEIRITIQQQDLVVFPYESYIYIEFNVTKKQGQDAVASAFSTNFAHFLFDEIRYELNGFEVDRCKNPGITSLMKSICAKSNAETAYRAIQGAYNGKEAAAGSYSIVVPLITLFGFVEDYTKIVMQSKHELILVRSRSDLNAFVSASDSTKFNIQKIQWKMPHVQVSDQSKLMLLRHIERKQPIHMAFRSWDLYEYPQLPTTSKHIWAVKTTNHLSKPRYVIVGFQTNRNQVAAQKTDGFDNCNISNVKLYLNSMCYPYDNFDADFNANKYVELYYTYANFKDAYYNADTKWGPGVDYETFKNSALFVFDCSHQDETVKNSSVDVRLEIQARANFPANTTAYCLIIHDNIVSYNPYTNIVTRTI